jgi:hypothetical protein
MNLAHLIHNSCPIILETTTMITVPILRSHTLPTNTAQVLAVTCLILRIAVRVLSLQPDPTLANVERRNLYQVVAVHHRHLIIQGMPDPTAPTDAPQRDRIR